MAGIGFRSVVAVALAVGLTAAAGALEFPVSFGKVWYRPAGSGKESGLLTVTADGLEFSSKKLSDFLPWSSVEMVSYGRMPGDPDTKWVVLGLTAVAGERRQAGIRDGARMGYGSATEEIFDAVVEGLRRAGAGPYEVEEGRVPYITRFLQFTLSLPHGWHALETSNTLLDGRPLWGTTWFSPRDLAELRSEPENYEDAIRAIEAAVAPAVRLDRFEAGDGLSCDRMTKAGRALLSVQIASALRPRVLVSEPEWKPRPHRGCTAWGATAAATDARGDTVELRLFAVSDGQTAYLLSTRGAAVDDAGFAAWTRSLRTLVAR